MSLPPARTSRQRTQDMLHCLQHDVDAWIATADPERGAPWLVPLACLRDGGNLLISTPASSPTGRNLQATGSVRVGIGPTQDLVLIDGAVTEMVVAGEIPEDTEDAFAVITGFDPRELTTPYLYFRIQPRRVQAWREVNELDGRDIMRDGVWLADD